LGLLAHPSEHKCVRCSREAVAYDHRSYTRPDNVYPVCGSCNARLGAASVNHRIVLDHINGMRCFYSYRKTQPSSLAVRYKDIPKSVRVTKAKGR
jgi:hypothetical protein